MSDNILDRFPLLPEETRGRKVYFDIMDGVTLAELQRRGYDPIITATMAVSTPNERVAQLRGVAQGLADGTIEGTTARLKGVELGMRSHGMLTERVKDTVSATKNPESTLELLEALKGDQGSALRNEVKTVDRDAILEKYAGSAKVRKPSGKLKATKQIKQEK